MGKEVDARTDVYSLGIVLYEMLTGDVPFHAETQVGVAMKHVNENVPDVQRKRPETSAALAAALERAVAKDPRDRYPDMNHFLSDLEGALEVEVVRAGQSTGEATTVLDSVPRKQRKLLTKRRISWAAVLLLIAAATAAIAIAAVTGDEGPSREAPPQSDSGGDPIEIVAADDFDPEPGDGVEHEDELSFAIDGNEAGTGWTTESYDLADFSGLKDGVGLVLDAGEPVTPTELAITTAVPGWTAEIYGSDASSPPTSLDKWGDPLAGPITIESDEQVIQLNAVEPNRYFLIWVTELAEGDDGFVAEVSNASLIS
jgi:serine/threonine-protein kinase